MKIKIKKKTLKLILDITFLIFYFYCIFELIKFSMNQELILMYNLNGSIVCFKQLKNGSFEVVKC